MRFLNLGHTTAALLLVVLSACTAVVVEDPGPDFNPRPGPRYCTRDYDPVCARRGGDRRTFANDCQAEAAGYRIIRGGECSRDLPPPVVRVCTREFDPVCARRGSRRESFPNACLAEEAGFRVVRGGECDRDSSGRTDVPDERVCTREYRPVCARRGSNVRTFGNSCEARSADYRIISDGPC